MKAQVIVFLVCTCFINACNRSIHPEGSEGSITAYSHQKISEFKKNHKVRGLAFALFNAEGIITQICMGKSTYGFPIDTQTLFSIQSISKNVTALAALIAAQDGQIDLDLPVSVYLPEFTVNSCYEASPENQMTIRQMLTHTAGFTHEAPVGNNYDYRDVDVEEHINSISQTWLKFPVGTGYSYSNLGYDLCTRIIRVQSGKSFTDFIKDRIFMPLEMTSTTADDDVVLANPNRTEGVTGFLKSTHVPIPLTGSGAVYTNLDDFVHYAQLHLNYGSWKGNQMLNKETLREMYTVERESYGLGIHLGISDSDYYLDHGGGGYGYTSHMLIYPEYGVGAVLLCNGNSSTFQICQEMIRMYIRQEEMTKNTSVSNLFDELNGDYFENPDRFNESTGSPCKGESDFRAAWEKYTGSYAPVLPGYTPKWYVKLALGLGYRPVKYKVSTKQNKLVFSDEYGEKMLREYQAGIFFTDEGEVLDLSSEPPTYRNILLEKR